MRLTANGRQWLGEEDIENKGARPAVSDERIEILGVVELEAPRGLHLVGTIDGDNMKVQIVL